MPHPPPPAACSATPPVVYFLLDCRFSDNSAVANGVKDLGHHRAEGEQLLRQWLRSVCDFGSLGIAQGFLVSVTVVVENGFKVYLPLGDHSAEDIHQSAVVIWREASALPKNLPEMVVVLDQDAAIGCLSKVTQHLLFFCRGKRRVCTEKLIHLTSPSVDRLLPCEESLRRICNEMSEEVGANLQLLYVVDSEGLVGDPTAVTRHANAEQLPIAVCDVENLNMKSILLEEGSLGFFSRDILARDLTFPSEIVFCDNIMPSDFVAMDENHAVGSNLRSIIKHGRHVQIRCVARPVSLSLPSAAIRGIRSFLSKAESPSAYVSFEVVGRLSVGSSLSQHLICGLPLVLSSPETVDEDDDEHLKSQKENGLSSETAQFTTLCAFLQSSMQCLLLRAPLDPIHLVCNSIVTPLARQTPKKNVSCNLFVASPAGICWSGSSQLLCIQGVVSGKFLMPIPQRMLKPAELDMPCEEESKTTEVAKRLVEQAKLIEEFNPLDWVGDESSVVCDSVKVAETDETQKPNTGCRNTVYKRSRSMTKSRASNSLSRAETIYEHDKKMQHYAEDSCKMFGQNTTERIKLRGKSLAASRETTDASTLDSLPLPLLDVGSSHTQNFRVGERFGRGGTKFGAGGSLQKKKALWR